MDDLDSKNNGSENNSGSYCQAEDKAEPDAWRWKQIKDAEKSTKYAGYYPYDSHEVANHWVNDLEPLFSQSSITDIINQRIEKQERRVEENSAFNQTNLNDAKARLQELKELQKVFNPE